MNKNFVLILGNRICIESIALYYMSEIQQTDYQAKV